MLLKKKPKTKGFAHSQFIFIGCVGLVFHWHVQQAVPEGQTRPVRKVFRTHNRTADVDVQVTASVFIQRRPRWRRQVALRHPVGGEGRPQIQQKRRDSAVVVGDDTRKEVAGEHQQQLVSVTDT